MRADEVLKKLYEHQARILGRIDASCALLSLDPMAARAPLARARWEMTRILREYQLFKHGTIFDPAIARGDEARADIARRMKANCLAAGNRFTVYAAYWSAVDVSAQWDACRAATRAMSDAIRTHVARERQQVEALLSCPARPPRKADRPFRDADPCQG